MSSTETQQVDDLRSDYRLLRLSILVLGVVFSVGASFQSVFVLNKVPLDVAGLVLQPVPDFLLRFGINLVMVLIITWLPAALRLIDRSAFGALLVGLGSVLIGSLARSSLQLLVGVHPLHPVSRVLSDAVLTFIVALFVLATAAAIVLPSRRAREAERERQLAASRAADALNDLQQEELRVRREIADTLHGTMQQRLVMLERTISEVALEAGSGFDRATGEAAATRLRAVSAELDSLRERELRELSAALYPEALDRGLVPAARAMVARLPASIPMRFIADEVPRVDPFTRTTRLLLVRIIEEGVSNALRHGKATSIELVLTSDQNDYRMELRHTGQEVVSNPTLRGLARLRCRLADHSGTLELVSEPGGGVLRMRLPLPAESIHADLQAAAG